MTRRRDKYSVSAPKNRVVSRITIEFATPPNGDARASRGRGHSDSDSDEQGTSLASQAAPTSGDASLVMIEHSHRPSRLRALRNYLVHRFIRGSSRHAEAETQAAMNEHATNEPNAPEPTSEERSTNDSTSSPNFPSAFTTELIVEASDARRRVGLERTICQIEERLARLSARLDVVERRLPDTSPLPSSTNSSPPSPPDNDRDLPKRSAAGGPSDVHSAPRARSTSPASSSVGPPSSRHSAPRALASDAQDVPLVAPPSTYASSSPSPPSHSPPGLQSHRRRTRPGAANGRNGPPVTPTTLNISGQSIVDPPSSTLEAWDGTLPDGVSNGVPSRSLQAPGGAASMAIGSYPLGGVQDDTDMPLSQPHANLDLSMPPPPPQLPIPLPDVEEHDDGAAPPPLRGPVSLPDIEEPEIKLTPLHLPDPLPTGDDFDSGDLDNALNLNMTHPELPILLPRLEYRHQSPTPSMVHDDPEADDLARERAKVRLLQLLHDSSRSSSISGAAQNIPGATGTMSDDIPRPAEQAGSTEAAPARAEADYEHGNGAAPTANSVLSTTTTTHVKTGAYVNLPRVDRVVDAPIISETNPTEMRNLSDPEELPTFVGSMDASRPCAGMRLLISVGDKSVPKGCLSHFSGDFEDAMAGLSGFCERPTVKHRLTQLYVRIHQPLDRHRQDVMMRIMRTLDMVLGCFHVVELYMTTESHLPLEKDFVRDRLTRLQRLLVEGEVSGRRLLCFPLHLINELDIRIPIDANDILELIERARSLHLLDINFRSNTLGSIFDSEDVQSASLLPICWPRAMHIRTTDDPQALERALQMYPLSADVRLLVMGRCPQRIRKLFADRAGRWSLICVPVQQQK